jgi:hypothetical protein
MNRITALLFFAVALSAAFPAEAQEELTPWQIEKLKRQAARAHQAMEELLNLERETARALQLSNGAFFRRVLSDEFVGTDLYGRVMDKAALLASVETPDVKYSSVIASDIKVRIIENTAVVTCLWTVRGTAGDRSFSRQSRITHIFISALGGWKVIASQETRLPG